MASLDKVGPTWTRKNKTLAKATRHRTPFCFDRVKSKNAKELTLRQSDVAQGFIHADLPNDPPQSTDFPIIPMVWNFKPKLEGFRPKVFTVPTSLRQAMTGPDSESWTSAVNQELKGTDSRAPNQSFSSEHSRSPRGSLPSCEPRTSRSSSGL